MNVSADCNALQLHLDSLLLVCTCRMLEKSAKALLHPGLRQREAESSNEERKNVHNGAAEAIYQTNGFVVYVAEGRHKRLRSTK